MRDASVIRLIREIAASSLRHGVIKEIKASVRERENDSAEIVDVALACVTSASTIFSIRSILFRRPPPLSLSLPLFSSLSVSLRGSHWLFLTQPDLIADTEGTSRRRPHIFSQVQVRRVCPCARAERRLNRCARSFIEIADLSVLPLERRVR